MNVIYGIELIQCNIIREGGTYSAPAVVCVRGNVPMCAPRVSRSCGVPGANHSRPWRTLMGDTTLNQRV